MSFVRFQKMFNISVSGSRAISGSGSRAISVSGSRAPGLCRAGMARGPASSWNQCHKGSACWGAGLTDFFATICIPKQVKSDQMTVKSAIYTKELSNIDQMAKKYWGLFFKLPIKSRSDLLGWTLTQGFKLDPRGEVPSFTPPLFSSGEYVRQYG
jgi:hypothetical protein